MLKRIILGLMGLAIVATGVASFSAFTAQWVNVHARVEKEIEVACVVSNGAGGYVVDPDGCDFGVTFPENIHEKNVEVALSNSFYNQNVKSDVLYWVLWECKQYSDGRDADGDGIPDCRVDVADPSADLYYNDEHGKWMHEDEALDGMIRDYIIVTPSDPSCLSTYTGPDFDVKYIEPVDLENNRGNGVVDRDTQPKCFYHLAYTPPACEGHMNPQTDPRGGNSPTIPCHEITTDPDPQEWDRFAEIGDDFKIQVYGFSFD